MSDESIGAYRNCAQEISTSSYARERMDPMPGDALYLVLSDLKLALEAHKDAAAIKVLDYGCGCSPYRKMFPAADYRRADFLDTGDLDYVLTADGAVEEEPNTFDLVLSSQVLEHVPSPACYLKDCLRLLKPGGKLLMSTHGSFEDHPCPVDFRRWTHQGLKQELDDAGFCDVDIKRLTTDMRAVTFLFQRFCGKAEYSSRSCAGLLFRILARLGRARKKNVDLACDRLFAKCRVVDDVSESKKNSFYIILFAATAKPM